MIDYFETALAHAAAAMLAAANVDELKEVGVMDRNAVRKYGKAAEVALRTTRFKFIPDWTAYNTARVVPEIERHVRDMLKSGGIAMTSWFDPEDRCWYKLPEPRRAPRVLRNLTLERAHELGFDNEADYGVAMMADRVGLTPGARAPVVFASDPGVAPKGAHHDVPAEAGITPPGQSAYQGLEPNAWDELGDTGRANYRANVREAVRRLAQTLDWSENLEIAQVKLIDQILHGVEWTMTSLTEQAKLVKSEIVSGMRANDDTEIPLQEVERLERRLVGYKEQYAAFMVIFQETMELRPDFTVQLPFEWPAYRSREQSAKDREGLRRLKGATSHTLAHVPKEVFETFLKREAERRGYVVRDDGVDARRD